MNFIFNNMYFHLSFLIGINLVATPLYIPLEDSLSSGGYPKNSVPSGHGSHITT